MCSGCRGSREPGSPVPHGSGEGSGLKEGQHPAPSHTAKHHTCQPEPGPLQKNAFREAGYCGNEGHQGQREGLLDLGDTDMAIVLLVWSDHY